MFHVTWKHLEWGWFRWLNYSWTNGEQAKLNARKLLDIKGSRGKDLEVEPGRIHPMEPMLLEKWTDAFAWPHLKTPLKWDGRVAPLWLNTVFKCGLQREAAPELGYSSGASLAGSPQCFYRSPQRTNQTLTSDRVRWGVFSRLQIAALQLDVTQSHTLATHWSLYSRWWLKIEMVTSEEVMFSLLLVCLLKGSVCARREKKLFKNLSITRWEVRARCALLVLDAVIPILWLKWIVD